MDGCCLGAGAYRSAWRSDCVSEAADFAETGGGFGALDMCVCTQRGLGGHANDIMDHKRNMNGSRHDDAGDDNAVIASGCARAQAENDQKKAKSRKVEKRKVTRETKSRNVEKSRKVEKFRKVEK